MAINRALEVSQALESMETEMRRLGLWHFEHPKPSAYTSQLPFCHDTMEFTQWLQFVLIERIRDLLRSDSPLPQDCSIAPYAEEAFKQVDADTDTLILIIRKLDASLSNSKNTH